MFVFSKVRPSGPLHFTRFEVKRKDSNTMEAWCRFHGSVSWIRKSLENCITRLIKLSREPVDRSAYCVAPQLVDLILPSKDSPCSLDAQPGDGARRFRSNPTSTLGTESKCCWTKCKWALYILANERCVCSNRSRCGHADVFNVHLFLCTIVNSSLQKSWLFLQIMVLFKITDFCICQGSWFLSGILFISCQIWF